MLERHAIFFYDGDCGFCNATVRFLLANTKANTLLFCSLQSQYATNFFVEHSQPQPDLTTAYLYYQGRFHQKSSAVLIAIKFTEGLVKHLSIFLKIPLLIRDGVYNLVSSMRKHIALGKGSCRLLTPEERKRFLSL